MSEHDQHVSTGGSQEAAHYPIPGAFPQPDPEPFKPQAIDVIIVKVMLSKGMGIPPEIVDIIADHAEYWASTEVSMDFTGANTVRIRGRGSTENTLLLRLPPIGFSAADVEDISSWVAANPRFQTACSELPSEHFKALLKTPPAFEHPVRKIVFKIRAKDQGWASGNRAGLGAFGGSYSWFEAGLERIDGNSMSEETESTPPFRAYTLSTIRPHVNTMTRTDGSLHHDFPINPDAQLTVQRNRVAEKAMSDYEIVWSWTDAADLDSLEAEHLDEVGRGRASGTGEFVRSLKLGDVVTLWGKARFSGWANNVDFASISVHWAI